MSRSRQLSNTKPADGKGVPGDVYTLAVFNPDALEDAAALLGKDEAATALFLALNAEAIDAERRRLEATSDKALLEFEAQQLALKLLRRMGEDVDNLDALEAADLIKHALRIIENADRVRLAEKADPNANLPVFNIVFHRPTGAITSELIKPADVLDVQGRTVQGGANE